MPTTTFLIVFIQFEMNVLTALNADTIPFFIPLTTVNTTDFMAFHIVDAAFLIPSQIGITKSFIPFQIASASSLIDSHALFRNSHKAKTMPFSRSTMLENMLFIPDQARSQSAVKIPAIKSIKPERKSITDPITTLTKSPIKAKTSPTRSLSRFRIGPTTSQTAEMMSPIPATILCISPPFSRNVVASFSKTVLTPLITTTTTFPAQSIMG